MSSQATLASLSSSAPVALADATQRRARDPHGSFWVTASAGSGKTKLLCDRVVSLLCHGAAPQSILCLTYTRAAASEMKQRVLSILQKIAHGDPAYRDFYDLLCQRGVDPVRFSLSLMDNQHRLSFQTIHAFCEHLLRRFPLEADISPDFQVLEEAEAQRLLTQAAEAFYDLDRIQGDDATATLLARYLNEGQYLDVLKPLIRKPYLLYQAVTIPLDMFQDTLKHHLDLPQDTEDLESLKAQMQTALPDADMHRMAEALSRSPSRTDQERSIFLSEFLAHDEYTKDYQRYIGFFLTSERKIRKTLATKKAPLSPEDRETLSREALRLYTLCQRCYAMECLQATVALRSVATAVWAAYIRTKEESHALDFDDLLEGTLRLLQNHNAWVAYKLEHALKHILLDEAQDTNPHQWTLMKHLLEETLSSDTETAKTLLVVGDYKQSIYRFQDADPEGYRAEYTVLQERYARAHRPLVPLKLETSFRTTPQVLGFVDAVFQNTPMGNGVLTPTEGPLIHHPARAEACGEVVLHPMIHLPVKNTEERFLLPTQQHHGQTPEAIIAETIAKSIEVMLASGKGLPSRQNRAITPSDIWILLQRRGRLQGALLSALAARRIPVAGGDRIFIKDTLAIKDLSALLLFMVAPEDDFTLACLLKSPVGGLDDDDLLTLCHGRAGSVWSALYHHAHRDAAPPKMQRAYARLQHFLNHADVWTPYETLVQYLCGQGGYGEFRTAFGGEVDEVLHLFLSYALRFETEETPTLAGFLPWFDRHAVDIKRETLGHGVRIQSIHSAKGLEAPVILLADAAHRPKSHFGPIVWLPQGFLWILPKRVVHALAPLKEAMKKQDDDEYHRLLYVAMTRAEDALHIFGAERQKNPTQDAKDETETDAEDDSPPNAALSPWYQALATVLKQRGVAGGDPARPTYRLGGLPEAERESVSSTPEAAEMPAWINALAPDGQAVPPQNTPPDTEAITLGLAIHLAMQHCLMGTMATQEALGVMLRNVYPPDIAETAAQRAWAAYQGQDLSPLCAQAQHIDTEVTLRYQGKTLRLDALMIFSDHILIVDFKSGNPHRAQAQMDLYKNALSALYPHHRVDTRVVGV